MFDKIKNLVDDLNVRDLSNYNQVKNSRKTLQEIKKEAQLLRDNLTKSHKNIKEGKEPVLKIQENVEDEDENEENNANKFDSMNEKYYSK